MKREEGHLLSENSQGCIRDLRKVKSRRVSERKICA